LSSQSRENLVMNTEKEGQREEGNEGQAYGIGSCVVEGQGGIRFELPEWQGVSIMW